MPSTLFDSAGLAIVAYAQVDGASGSSTSTALANSGVSTTRTSTGVYYVALPTGLTQDLSRDLIFVQTKVTTALPSPNNGPRTANLFEVDAGKKAVTIYGASPTMSTTAIDSDFDVLVLRTILP